MACNYVNRVVDMKNSDTLSEVSESGTSGFNSNWGSREELRDFVTKHGCQDVSDLYQDRFRVDRKKLEQMLSGDNDALIPADVFFSKIMEDTDTFITWPNKLKLGAKSKKDPHVRIAGKQDNVQAAKERILTILYTRCNRVTMKMDISYTDHSHIIGKGGLSIKRVMEETQCHVHFPDSNRLNQLDKSNQVSISGDLEGVESARSRVRELIPLIFGFEPPIMSQNVDSSSPYVAEIQEQYKVQVMFKTRSKLHATIVLVKGVEWELDQVKKATLLLMEFMCDNLANQIPIQMSIQISPQHHQIVLGKNHANLKAIMQFTNCQIMFPDAQDQNIPNLKKSNVNISGNIHNVYMARQLLMGSLPLLIIFDLPEDTSCLKVKQEQITDIQNSCDVAINIRQKTKQTIKACIIKGIEKHAVNIYKARNIILGIDEPPISADIPRTYHLPVLTPAAPPPSPFSPNDLIPTPTNVNPDPFSPLLTPSMLSATTWQYPMASPSHNYPLYHHFHQQQSPFLGLLQKPQFMYNFMQNSQGSSGFQSFGPISGSSSEQSRDSDLLSSISSNNSTSGFMASPRSSQSPQKGAFKRFSEQVEKTEQAQSETKSFDYENKRLAGLRAMQARPNPNMYRLPTNTWSGYGISHTSPAGFGLDNAKGKKESDELWKSPDQNMPPTCSLNTSNILDHTPSHIVNRVMSSTWPDLPTLLNSLGLDRYVSLFIKQEVDLATFATLSDQDLLDIGVSAFGSRRKMILAISELNKRSSTFSIAPGAERKSSSTSNSSYGNSPRENW